MASLTKLLASLGSPANRVSLPSGTRSAQSHSTSPGSNSTTHVIRTPGSGSADSCGAETAGQRGNRRWRWG
jgi:hypothetical protein